MNSFTLTQLDAHTFEHLVNAIALRVLGNGATGFGPGADGGRDGYFSGQANYPSPAEQWSGIWYIQSKYHAPHLTHNEQQWLLSQISTELTEFQKHNSKRRWPDIWIIATNINPSPTPQKGLFDKARDLIKQVRPQLAERFDIWGGDKILNFIHEHQDISNRYGDFLTPGHLLAEITRTLSEDRATHEEIIKKLTTDALRDQRHTKLEQAGAVMDNRPELHTLFVDLPFTIKGSENKRDNSKQEDPHNKQALALATISRASAENYKDHEGYKHNSIHQKTRTAPVWFIKGGPGQGKSTISQFYCQIQRSSLILETKQAIRTPLNIKSIAEEIKALTVKQNIWPLAPRIPVFIELKDYAKWSSLRPEDAPTGVLSYTASKLSQEIEKTVTTGTIKRLLTKFRWAFIFDGLDEVPSNSKDALAIAIKSFTQDTQDSADIFIICTSRPQGYSGQFDSFAWSKNIILTHLTPEQALSCAEPVIRHDRPRIDTDESIHTLKEAMEQPAVRELMISPLQAHIMAVLVRDGRRPPEKKWDLYRQFYETIRTREANKNFQDKHLARVLQQDSALLKQVHNRLGFTLHSRAETETGAHSSLDRDSFKKLVHELASEHKEDSETIRTTEILVTAAEQRLVLISTPDDGAQVRFDIRQLQEFFAAEFLYDGATPDQLRARLQLIAGDSHWQEVTHFLLSALVGQNRRTELAVANAVLQELDMASQAPETSDLSGSIALGASIVARLLEDGVFEESKAIRSAFSDRLAPITQTSFSELFSPLLNATGPTTRHWLKTLLVRHIQGSTPHHAIGALRWLWLTLSDGDPETSVVETLIDNAPLEISSRIFDPPLPAGEHGTWRYEILARIFSSEHHLPLSIAIFNRLRHLPSFRPENLRNILALISNTTNEEATALGYFLRGRSSPIESTADFGSISIGFHTTSLHNAEQIEEAQPIQREPCLLSVASAALRVAITPNSAANILLYYKLINNLPEASPAFGINLTRLHAIAEKNGTTLAALLSTTAYESQLSYASKLFPPILINPHFRFESRPDRLFLEDEFIEFAKSEPEIALTAFSLQYTPKQGERLSASLSNSLLDATIAAPSQALRYPHTWGLIFTGLHPTKEATARSALSKHANSHVADFNPFINRQSVTYPELLLPEEHALLAPVVTQLLETTFDHPRFAATNRIKSTSGLDYVGFVAARLVSSLAPLIEIADNPQYAAKSSLAAILTGGFHPLGGVDFLFSRASRVLDCIKEYPGLSYLVPILIDIHRVERMHEAKVLLSRILGEIRHNTEAKDKWWSILNKWREQSYSPISTSGVERTILLGLDHLSNAKIP